MPKGRLAREKSLVGAMSSQDDGGAEMLVEGAIFAVLIGCFVVTIN